MGLTRAICAAGLAFATLGAGGALVARQLVPPAADAEVRVAAPTPSVSSALSRDRFPGSRMSGQRLTCGNLGETLPWFPLHPASGGMEIVFRPDPRVYPPALRIRSDGPADPPAAQARR